MSEVIGKRQQRTMENRSLILTTAHRLFNEAGYEQTTMADIQKETGLTNGTIYHLFKNKQDILTEIYHQYFRPNIGLCENMEEKVLFPVSHILQFLNCFEQQWMDAGCVVASNIYLIHQDQGYSTNAQTIIPHSESYALYGPTAHKELLCFLTEVDRVDGLREGLSPETVVDCIFIFGRGLLFSWSMAKGTYNLVESSEHLWNAFLPSFFRNT